MSDQEGIIQRLLARVTALLPDDWKGRAGERFRKTTAAISEFAEENDLHLRDVAQETITLGRRKLEGLANKEYAAAVKDFAAAEDKEIETELKRRSLESEVRRKEAETRKTEAEARTAEIESLCAEMELLKKLNELGVILRCDADGKYTVLPSPKSFNFGELKQRFISENDKKCIPEKTPPE